MIIGYKKSKLISRFFFSLVFLGLVFTISYLFVENFTKVNLGDKIWLSFLIVIFSLGLWITWTENQYITISSQEISFYERQLTFLYKKKSIDLAKVTKIKIVRSARTDRDGWGIGYDFVFIDRDLTETKVNTGKWLVKVDKLDIQNAIYPANIEIEYS